MARILALWSGCFVLLASITSATSLQAQTALEKRQQTANALADTLRFRGYTQ